MYFKCVKQDRSQECLTRIQTKRYVIMITLIKLGSAQNTRHGNMHLPLTVASDTRTIDFLFFKKGTNALEMKARTFKESSKEI